MPKSVVSITPLFLLGKIRCSLFLLTVLFIAAAGSAASLNLAQAQSTNGMYDADGNRLIEISNLQQLFFIRHDLNGDGSADASSNDASYALGFPLSGNKKICDRTCRGYELTRSLDFNDGNSYQLGEVNTIWTEGAGWPPIQEFRATFDGNGHTISNLYMDVALQQSQPYAGLFGSIFSNSADSPAVIEDIGLLNVEVTGGSHVGGLVGYIRSGRVSRSYVTGAVSGTGSNIGGLVGLSSGEISESYSTAAVEDTDRAPAESAVGGLVGFSNGEISESYATGQSTGYRSVGGLAGVSSSSSLGQRLIHSSYATGRVTGDSRVGGLVGTSQSRYTPYSTITDSYAIGAVAGDEDTGGLLGYGGSTSTTINNSYWNTDVIATGVGGGGALGAAGRTTAELQRPTGRTGFYSLWTSPNWDFGNSSQYPALKADLDGDGTATAAEFGGQDRVAPAPQSLPGSVPMVEFSIDDSQPRMIRIGSPVPVIAMFTEAVSGFTVDDITVVNGTVGNFVADAGGMVYTFNVTPDAIAEVTVDMASGLAMDADDNGNTAAAQLSFAPYDDDGVAGISKAEAIAAIRDYFSGKLDKAQAIAVIRLYFASGN